MTTVFLEDSFDAAHWLPHVPQGHKCRRMHGHTYRIRIEIRGPLTMGFVVDYAEVKCAWEPLKTMLDHVTINDVIGLENSTCENIAEWVYVRLKQALPGLSRVEIRETATCGAYYDGD